MNAPRFRKKPKTSFLFVWNGTNQNIEEVDILMKESANYTLSAVCVLPHESIYNYGAVLHESMEPSKFEQRLKRKFKGFVQDVCAFKNVRLELLFGDLIEEISLFAGAIRASTVLAPSFSQSKFSRWIHGDLNQKLAYKSPCPVVFLKTGYNQQKMPVRSVVSHYWS